MIGGPVQAEPPQVRSKAASLGTYNTNFINANGYSKPDRYSTAYDLAVISRSALANPEFAALVGTKEAVIHWENRDKKVTVIPGDYRVQKGMRGLPEQILTICSA